MGTELKMSARFRADRDCRGPVSYSHIGPEVPSPMAATYLRPGRCVRADPAAVFAALLEFGSLRTFEAADAAFLLVTSDFAKYLTSLLTLDHLSISS